MKNGNYAMYLRKSRADRENEARGEMETLARHEKLLFETAKRMQITVSAVYKEIVSGETISARPVMQKLLTEIEQGVWDGVLVVEVERLARGDTIDQGIVSQAFKLSDTKIITPVKVYDPNNEFDEEYFEFGLFMSRREYNTIKRRLQRGRLASVREGKYVGNRPPYGYERVKIPNDKGFTLSPLPEQAKIVKYVYDLYAYGLDGEEMGTAKIVRKLNDLQIPTQSGGKWIPPTIRDMLYNPVYIGKLRWNRRSATKKVCDGKITYSRPTSKEYEMCDGLHPAIIDPETFKICQKKLSKNQSRPVGLDKTIKNPLGGLVICSKCGRRMVRRPYNKTGQRSTLICPYTHCDNVSSPLEDVETMVLEAIADIVKNERIEPTTSVIPSDTLDILKDALKNQETSLETLQKQQNSLYDLLEQGIYTTDVFLERSNTLKEQITAADSSIQNLKKKISAEQNRLKIQADFIPKCEHLLDIYDTLDTPEKNRILKELIDHIDYLKEEKNVPFTKKDAKVFIHVYPRTPE